MCQKLLFALAALFVLLCHAQVMPAIPANFMSSFRWSISDGGGVHISNGYYWTDTPSNHTRWQYLQQSGSGPAVNNTVWRFATPTPNVFNYYFYQYSTCSRYQISVVLNCQPPRYLGVRVYNGQQAQAFLLNCTAQTSHTRLWLFSTATQQPLELLISEVASTYTSITSFSNFALNQATSNLWQLPSGCPTSNSENRIDLPLPPDPRIG